MKPGILENQYEWSAPTPLQWSLIRRGTGNCEANVIRRPQATGTCLTLTVVVVPAYYQPRYLTRNIHVDTGHLNLE